MSKNSCAAAESTESAVLRMARVNCNVCTYIEKNILKETVAM